MTETLALLGVAGQYTDNVPGLVQHLAATGEPGDVVLILSNGAFDGIYQQIAATCR